ncbi:MAG: cation:proton antiporter [Bacteriovoracaceae bacterium]|jgi:Kef-type K+ transport system membrane component KefB|nr:cation:proton antiporter [Bacteriovoracaceae bacterium]
MSNYLHIFIFAGVLILTKLFLRFKIPMGVSSFAIGVLITLNGFNLLQDPVFNFLAQVGITSLFLFAGLEVELQDIIKNKVYFFKYSIKYILTLLFFSLVFFYVFEAVYLDSLLFTLGIFTPSAGFILNSLDNIDVENDKTEYWIKSKAITKEIIGIIIFFIVMQSQSLSLFFSSSIYVILLALFVPFMYKIYISFIMPYAKDSQVPFLIMLALVCGVLSKSFGAYYLTGAFITGLGGVFFLNDLAVDGHESFFKSLGSIVALFLPFYFLIAGSSINIGLFSYQSVLVAFVLALVFVPVRMKMLSLGFKLFDIADEKNKKQIAVALLPTLVFGLIICQTLLERDNIKPFIVYALLTYTFITTLTPSFISFFRKKL